MDISTKQEKWRQERPLFEAEFIHSHLLPFFNFNENTGDYEIKSECVNNTDDEDRKVAYEALNTGWVMWLRAKRDAKAQAVPEVAQRQGGYYIRDLRSQPGNCMKFWYQAGYGTKHKNFFWCATLEEAKEYKGGCDWFEIWHAPYIDSLVEYTVDFQLADRGVGLVDLKAQEPAND
ncbi:hypothetical protein J559_1844 [Acinetobacter sp. 983759]|uniref:hypothetical protein n=1 Tax=Acinetobacter sp. 983759 TaxID=1310660 RepID=UPI00044E87A7|nr:hypothetical protein [Acinetobacter sp. 983759]EXE14184.1 hypothetical protein J559_1844 [Acinetobacter sp. 983759]